MSDNDTTYPDAEQPDNVAQSIYEMEGIAHVASESNLKSSGVEYEVNVWVDDDDDARQVARVAKALQRAGYSIVIGTVESTDSVKVSGEAEA